MIPSGVSRSNYTLYASDTADRFTATRIAVDDLEEISVRISRVTDGRQNEKATDGGSLW